MSVIYLNEESVRLKSYGATTKGEKSSLFVKLSDNSNATKVKAL